MFTAVLAIIFVQVTLSLSLSSSDTLYYGDQFIHAAGRHNGKCESVTNLLCKDVGYNDTILPNHFNHASQYSAGLEMHRYAPLIKVNCSQDLKLFLCTIFFPPCTQLETPIKPCRSLCSSVKKGCQLLFSQFGLNWPEPFNCSEFPVAQPCVIRDGNPTISDVSSIPSPGVFSSSDAHPNPSGGHRFSCPIYLTTPEELNYVFRINGKYHYDCGTPCDDFIFDNEKKNTIRFFILFASILCLISVSATMSNFWLSSERIDYPQKSLAFLSVCYLIISLVYIIGHFSGDRIACNNPFSSPPQHPYAPMIRTLTQGIHKESCTLSFMFLFFAQNASFFWFLVLCFTWFLTTFYAWTPEALDKKSGFFHAIVWGLSCIIMFLCISNKKIQGDVLSGVCFLRLWDHENLWFSWDSASSLNLSLSLIFFLISFVSSWHIRKSHRSAGRSTKKMDALIFKLTLFSLVYLFSTIVLIGCHAYEEHNIDSWILAWQMKVCKRKHSVIHCPTASEKPHEPMLGLFMAKFTAQLLPGIAIFCPFVSKKSFESWFSFCGKVLQCNSKQPKSYSHTIPLDKFSAKA